MLITQCREYPCGRESHSAFGVAFVLRMLDSGGNYSRVIVLGKFLIASVEDCFIAGVLNDSGLEVVRDKKASRSAEVFVGMDMAVKPVFELRVGGGFGVCVSAA